MTRAPGEEDVIPLAAAQTAVALLARHRAPDVPRGDVLDGQDPADVLAAMEAIAGGLVAGVCPAGRGAHMLRQIGLAFAGMGGGSANG